MVGVAVPDPDTLPGFAKKQLGLSGSVEDLARNPVSLRYDSLTCIIQLILEGDTHTLPSMSRWLVMLGSNTIDMAQMGRALLAVIGGFYLYLGGLDTGLTD